MIENSYSRKMRYFIVIADFFKFLIKALYRDLKFHRPKNAYSNHRNNLGGLIWGGSRPVFRFVLFSEGVGGKN